MTIEERLASLSGRLPSSVGDVVSLGVGIADGYDFYDSVVGRVVVTFGINGVTSVNLAEGDFAGAFLATHGRRLIRARAPEAWGKHIPAAIEAGTPGPVPVDLTGITGFRARVLEVTAEIPRGQVRPYGWIAEKLENPKAVRAVGSALARNPIPLIIPCHRVVRSDGHVGNYSLGGREFKIRLLESEGALPEAML